MVYEYSKIFMDNIMYYTILYDYLNACYKLFVSIFNLHNPIQESSFNNINDYLLINYIKKEFITNVFENGNNKDIIELVQQTIMIMSKSLCYKNKIISDDEITILLYFSKRLVEFIDISDKYGNCLDEDDSMVYLYIQFIHSCPTQFIVYYANNIQNIVILESVNPITLVEWLNHSQKLYNTVTGYRNINNYLRYFITPTSLNI